MNRIDVLRPTDIQEACDAASDEDAVLVAGGLSIAPAIQNGLLAPRTLVLLDRISELRELTIGPELVRIGAMVNHSTIGNHPALRAMLPVLTRTFTAFANPQVRNAGTLGGNLSQAIPVYDPPGILTALRSRVRVVGPEGSREIDLEDLAIAPMMTSLADGEIITTVEFIPPSPDTVLAYTRFRPATHDDIPTLTAAATLTHRDGVVSELRLAMGGTGPTTQLIEATDRLVGLDLADIATNIGAFTEAVSAETTPYSDGAGSADYKRHVAGVIAGRVLRDCVTATGADHV